MKNKELPKWTEEPFDDTKNIPIEFKKLDYITIATIDEETGKCEPVDLVLVIRCKDCKYYDAPYHCLRHMSKDYQWFVEENDYCSLAERNKEKTQ